MRYTTYSYRDSFIVEKNGYLVEHEVIASPDLSPILQEECKIARIKQALHSD
jgi:hypothetical protein